MCFVLVSGIFLVNKGCGGRLEKSFPTCAILFDCGDELVLTSSILLGQGPVHSERRQVDECSLRSCVCLFP